MLNFSLPLWFSVSRVANQSKTSYYTGTPTKLWEPLLFHRRIEKSFLRNWIKNKDATKLQKEVYFFPDSCLSASRSGRALENGTEADAGIYIYDCTWIGSCKYDPLEKLEKKATCFLANFFRVIQFYYLIY